MLFYKIRFLSRAKKDLNRIAIYMKVYNANKIIQKMIGIPILTDIQSKSDQAIMDNYVKNLLQLEKDTDISYILDEQNKILKIPFYTKLVWNKQICSLVGATDKVEVCNARELKIDKLNLCNWKYTLNVLLNKKKKIESFDFLYV